jgi:hypothetical protein
MSPLSCCHAAAVQHCRCHRCRCAAAATTMLPRCCRHTAATATLLPPPCFLPPLLCCHQAATTATATMQPPPLPLLPSCHRCHYLHCEICFDDEKELCMMIDIDFFQLSWLFQLGIEFLHGEMLSVFNALI